MKAYFLSKTLRKKVTICLISGSQITASLEWRYMIEIFPDKDLYTTRQLLNACLEKSNLRANLQSGETASIMARETSGERTC